MLVPVLTGLSPTVALFTAGLGTLIFQLVTGGKVPVFLASSSEVYGKGVRAPFAEDDDSVLVRTASKVNVRLKPIRHHLTPEGSSCLGSFVNGNLIARCVLPEQTAAQFLRLGILEETTGYKRNRRFLYQEYFDLFVKD